MAYTEEEARERVVAAGHELLAKQLVARTWGNISARISDTEFVITPSGRGYEDLKPEELVRVKIEDCSYDKNEGKPSSEKGIHADVYKLHPEANFVVHTHQTYASAASCFITTLVNVTPVSDDPDDVRFNETDQLLDDDRSCLTTIPYALPGTKALRRNAYKEIKKFLDARRRQNVYLMARHGALAFGQTDQFVFEILDELETACKFYVEEMMDPPNEKLDSLPFLDDYAQIMGNHLKVKTNEDEETLRLIKEKNSIAARYCRGFGIKDFPPLNKFDVWLQHTVYVYKYSKLKK